MAVGFSTFAFNGALLGVGCRGLLDLLNMYSERLETEGAYAAVGMGCSAAFLHLQMQHIFPEIILPRGSIGCRDT